MILTCLPAISPQRGTSRKFIRLIDKSIDQIICQPETDLFSSFRSGLRKYIASKIHTPYDPVEENIIYIVAIGNNLSNIGKSHNVLK